MATPRKRSTARKAVSRGTAKGKTNSAAVTTAVERQKAAAKRRGKPLTRKQIEDITKSMQATVRRRKK